MCTTPSWALEKTFLWLQRVVCVSSSLSCLSVFVVLSCVMLRKASVGSREEVISPPCGRFFHPESSNQGRGQIYFLLSPIFFYFWSNRKHTMQLYCKQTAQEPSVLLQLGTDFMLNPQYKERSHVCRKLSNWRMRQKSIFLCGGRVLLPGCSPDMSCTSTCTVLKGAAGTDSVRP